MVFTKHARPLMTASILSPSNLEILKTTAESFLIAFENIASKAAALTDLGAIATLNENFEKYLSNLLQGVMNIVPKDFIRLDDEFEAQLVDFINKVVSKNIELWEENIQVEFEGKIITTDFVTALLFYHRELTIPLARSGLGKISESIINEQFLVFKVPANYFPGFDYSPE